MVTALAQRRATSLALPPIDLRPHLTPSVRAQGTRPLCVPFAVGAAHEAARSTMLAEYDPLAVESLWQHGIQACTAGPTGTSLAAAGAALAATGQTLEQQWPYNSALGAGTEPMPSGITPADFRTASLISVPLQHDGIEEQVEQALTLGLTVALVVEVTDEFDDAPGGEIAVPALTAALGDYHAVLAVGVATNPTATTRRLLVRNSWGPGWGANGHAWLPYDYLVAHAVDAAAIDPRTLRTR